MKKIYAYKSGSSHLQRFLLTLISYSNMIRYVPLPIVFALLFLPKTYVYLDLLMSFPLELLKCKILTSCYRTLKI